MDFEDGVKVVHNINRSRSSDKAITSWRWLKLSWFLQEGFSVCHRSLILHGQRYKGEPSWYDHPIFWCSPMSSCHILVSFENSQGEVCELIQRAVTLFNWRSSRAPPRQSCKHCLRFWINESVLSRILWQHKYSIMNLSFESSTLNIAY